MAGAKGSEERRASSWALGGGGASGAATVVFSFCPGTPSSVSIGGGSRMAGRGSALSIVLMSEDVAAAARRAGWPLLGAGWLQATVSVAASKGRLRFIGTDLCRRRSTHACPASRSLRDRASSDLRDQRLAREPDVLPGLTFVRVGVHDQHEVVALLERAAQDLGVLERDRDPVGLAPVDVPAQPAGLGEEHPGVGADGFQPVLADVEDTLRAQCHRLPLVIEEDRTDGVGGAEKLAEDSLEGHGQCPGSFTSCRDAWLLGNWVAELLGCWGTGLLGYCVTGCLGYWVAGLLGC